MPITGQRLEKGRLKLKDSVGRRREAHDLVAEILTLARNGQRKTYLQAKVGLCNAQSKRYFEGLKQAGFIDENLGIWKTTDRGATVIEVCELCRQFMHELP